MKQDRSHKLYRAAEGSVTLVSTPEEAVVPGVYDRDNWATDWVLITARNPSDALKIAAAYDAQDRNPSMRPGYLKPVGSSAVRFRK